MKSLTESLFDGDLIKKELPYNKLIKFIQSSSNLEKLHIREFVAGLEHSGVADHITNPLLRDWCNELGNKYFNYLPGKLSITSIDPKSDDKEAMNWLKFGEIHNNVSWNDSMYANSFDIPWSFWYDKGNKKQDVYEWIIFTTGNNDVINAMHAVLTNVIVIVNRKSYDEIDQKLLHAMIETIHKYYKKGTR